MRRHGRQAARAVVALPLVPLRRPTPHPLGLSSARVRVNEQSDPFPPVDVRELKFRVDSHGRRIDALETDVAEVRADVEQIASQLKAAVAASHRAASAAAENVAAISALRTGVAAQIASMTAEIVAALRARAPEARAAEFEAHLVRATDAATARLAEAASQSGDVLTRRVTVPVGVIMLVGLILQWVVRHVS